MKRKRLNCSPLNYQQGSVLVAARDGKASNLTGSRKATATSLMRRGWITADRSGLTVAGIMALSNLQAWEARYGHSITGR
jgi:hypothetical protein